MALMAYWKGTLIFTWHETSEIHIQWFWPLRWRRWCSSQVFSIWLWGNSVSELMLRESSSHGHPWLDDDLGSHDLHIYITIHNTICIYIYSISCWPWRPILVEEICVLPLWIPIRSIEYLQVDPTCCVFEVGLLPKNSLPKGQHIISPKKRCSNYCSWCWCFNQAVVDDVQTGFMFLFNMGPPSCKLVYNPI